MAGPKKPSDQGVRTLFFSNPNDLAEAIALEVIDTGLVTPGNNKIFRLSVGSGGGTLPSIPSAIDGNEIILAGGVEQLPSFALVNSIVLKADGGNAGTIWIKGDNTVAASNGYPLLPGSNVTIPVDDLDKIFVFATIGDKLYYLGG